MPELRLSEIPEYLRGGALYKIMLENDDGQDEAVHFDAEVLKKNTEIRFFVDIAAFVMSHSAPETDEVLARNEERFAYIRALRVVAKKIHRKRIHDAVIQSGCVELVEYFLQLGDKLPEQTGCLLATQINDVKMLAFVHQHGCVVDDSAGKEAALHGYFDCLDYLCSTGARLKDCLLVEAAKGGSIACLQRLYEHEHFWAKKKVKQEYPRKMAVCMAAASRGHVHIFKFMKERTDIATMYSSFANEAASAGQLDCLKYLHENGYAWNKGTIARAAAHGHLHCLQYMHEQGCPWSDVTCAAAAEGGHAECLEYAKKHRCPPAEPSDFVSLSSIRDNPVPPFGKRRMVTGSILHI